MPSFQHGIDFLRAEMGIILTSTVERLLLAAILGGIIGLERQFRHKAAGLRTNMLICFGAAMFTILSDELAGRFGGDHMRIAAQIVPGIGFIGAGAILRERGSVIGLTSAATIFVTASIGMAAGGGLYMTATFATFVALGALVILGKLEDYFERRNPKPVPE
jgi:putative Mg2+ transporter-C (MgtC) family protein